MPPWALPPTWFYPASNGSEPQSSRAKDLGLFLPGEEWAL